MISSKDLRMAHRIIVSDSIIQLPASQHHGAGVSHSCYIIKLYHHDHEDMTLPELNLNC